MIELKPEFVTLTFKTKDGRMLEEIGTKNDYKSRIEWNTQFDLEFVSMKTL